MPFLSQEQISKKSIKVSSDKGIYFLIKQNKIIYIGSSTVCCLTRIGSHAKEKIFDSYYILEMSNSTDEEIWSTEIDYIKHFNPKLNLTHSNCMGTPTQKENEESISILNRIPRKGRAAKEDAYVKIKYGGAYIPLKPDN